MGVEKIFSFGSWDTDHPADRHPGERIDAQFDAHANAIRALEARIDAIVRADGKLHADVIPIFSPRQIAAPKSGFSHPGSTNVATLSDAAAENWAEVSMEWAEHMPDTIPGGILASNAITGDHWSSRWWANQAARLAGRGTVAVTKLKHFPFDGATATFPLLDDATSAPIVPATNVSQLSIVVDGVTQEPGVDFVLAAAGASVTFTSISAADAKNFATYALQGETSAAAITSTVVLFPSRTAAAAALLPLTLQALATAGHATPGDGGSEIFYRVGGSTLGGFQSADGAWWALEGASRTRFWSDVNNGAAITTPRVLSHRQRIFVGAATNWGDLNLLTGTHDFGWMTPANSPTYLARDGQLVVMQEDGGTAVAGISRTSDSPTGVGAIGVGGYALGDNPAGTPSWAGYFEAVKGAGGAATGIEIDVRNCGVPSVPTPYTAGVAPHALWVACGPGSVGGTGGYGPAATADAGAAIGILQNSSGSNAFKFSKGILFFATALSGVTGVDGEVPVAGAIEMGRNHEIRWYSAGPTLKARFRSSLDAADPDWLVYWAGNNMLFSRVGASQNVFVMNGVASAANYLIAGNAVAGSNPTLQANGPDTNIGFNLFTKGSGVLQFGVNTAKAAEAFASYITIKDAGGVLRKLMVCA